MLSRPLKVGSSKTLGMRTDTRSPTTLREMVRLTVVMGGPDILPYRTALINSNRIYEQFQGRLKLFCSAQYDSYSHHKSDVSNKTKGQFHRGEKPIHPEGFVPMEQIFLYGRDQMHLNYIFWSYITSRPKAYPGDPSAFVFEDALKTLCTTNCTWALTETMVRNLVEALGEEGPTGARTFPTPEAMARRPERFYRERVRAGYRAPYLAALPADVAEFTYDAIGNLKTANNNDARVTRDYFPNGALKTETQAIAIFDDLTPLDNRFNSHRYRLDFTYDLSGRRLARTDSIPGCIGCVQTYHYHPASGFLDGARARG